MSRVTKYTLHYGLKFLTINTQTEIESWEKDWTLGANVTDALHVSEVLPLTVPPTEVCFTKIS